MYSVQMAFLVGALLHVGLCPVKSSMTDQTPSIFAQVKSGESSPL
jgi:hypothetical protein